MESWVEVEERVKKLTVINHENPAMMLNATQHVSLLAVGNSPILAIHFGVRSSQATTFQVIDMNETSEVLTIARLDLLADPYVLMIMWMWSWILSSLTTLTTDENTVI
ncbi:hypothetical protein V8G54_012531 [Vigna mungo]|uniref:Uncharacterized protein n=1 Tax=Vigna mungo TaxID=3915 RepID=A0AAQ3NTB3_VIGMU